MNEQNSVEQIFFRYLMQYEFEPYNLDYTLVKNHARVLQNLSDVSNSGTSIFDLCQRQILFYSSNYGRLLGYVPSDYQAIGQQFFEQRIHEQDKYRSSMNGVSVLKLFNNFSREEKLNHKLVNEYRILNAKDQYVRLIEQHQVLELDAKGQVWLLMSVVDISPDQQEQDGFKSQLLNFRTGQSFAMETPAKAQFEVTKRELEILKLVRDGMLSKEISEKLSISVNTVNTHRQRFLEKLGANNSMEAIAFASRFGLLD